jgi:thiol-disulfide isomerase/thioredoxin
MSSGVTVLKFTSPTCGPCRTIKPALEAMAEDFPNVTWIEINTKDDREGYVDKYRVTVVPTLVFLKGGVEVARHTGANMGMFYTLLRKALAA